MGLQITFTPSDGGVAPFSALSAGTCFFQGSPKHAFRKWASALGSGENCYCFDLNLPGTMSAGDSCQPADMKLDLVV